MMGWLMGWPKVQNRRGRQDMKTLGVITFATPLAVIIVDCWREIKDEPLRREQQQSQWIVEIEED
jgi:hypothetical protein